VGGGGWSVAVDSALAQGFCLPADCAMALSHLGKAGKLSGADGRGTGKISLIPYLRCGDDVVPGGLSGEGQPHYFSRFEQQIGFALHSQLRCFLLESTFPVSSTHQTPPPESLQRA
jgi:hypothetical protein